MAIKVYRPTDSLQIYFETGSIDPVLVTATHLRITVEQEEKIKIKDVLFDKEIVRATLFSELQDEAGASIGATIADALLYLVKIIG